MDKKERSAETQGIIKGALIAGVFAILAAIAQPIVTRLINPDPTATPTPTATPPPTPTPFATQKSIIGEWRFSRFENGEPGKNDLRFVEIKPETITFYTDGSYSAQGTIFRGGEDSRWTKRKQEGGYQFLNDEKLFLSIDILNSLTFEVSIQGNELRLTDDEGYTIIFSRVS